MRCALAALLLLLGAGCTQLGLDQGHRFACSPERRRESPGECPGGWFCGVEGYCIDPDAPAPYPCQEHLDCTPGWRCGLDGRCHSTAVAAPYACRSDDDCEQSWRCGYAGTCVDSSAEALRANAGVAGLTAVREGPTALDGPSDLVELGEPFVRANACGKAVQTRSLVHRVKGAVAGQSRLVKRLLHGNGGLPMDGAGGLATVCTGAEPRVDAEVVELAGPGVAGSASADDVRAIADFHDATYALRQDGGFSAWEHLYFHRSRLFPTPPPAPPGAPFAPRELRQFVDGNGKQWVVAFGGSALAFYERGAGWSSPTTFASDAGTVELRDVALLSRAQLLVASSAGFHAAPWSGSVPAPSDWRMVRLADLGCPVAGKNSYEAREIRAPYAGSELLGLGVTSLQALADGGTARRDLFQLYGLSTDAGAPGDCPELVLPGEPGHTAYAVRGNSSCAGCATGETMEGVVFGADGRDRLEGAVAFRCRAGDGTSRAELVAYPDAERCQLLPREKLSAASAASAFTTPGAVFSRARAAGRAVAVASPAGGVGASGGLWWSARSGVFQLSPLLPAQPPSAWVEALAQPERRWVTTPSVRVGAVEPAGVVQLEEPGHFVPRGEGASARFSAVASSSLTLPLVAEVEGRTDWVVAWFDRGEWGEGRPYDALVLQRSSASTGADAFSLIAQVPKGAVVGPPFASAVTALPEGGTLLLLSAQEALFAADVTATAQAALPLEQLERAPVLEVVAVPLTRGRIGSLTATGFEVDASKHARYAKGFLVASSRLFQFRADNPVVWRLDELELEPAEVVRLWRDGAKARVGYRDGSVYALPSRAKVAPALQPGATQVQDFADVCGRVLALSTSGLFHLTVDDGTTLGRWEPVALSTDPTPQAYVGARLRAVGGAVQLLLADGQVWKVSGFACP